MSFPVQIPHSGLRKANLSLYSPTANASRTLENYKASAAALDGGNAGQPGGVPGGDNNTPGGVPNQPNQPGQPTNPGQEGAEGGNQPAAGSALAVPSTLLLAAGAFFLLF